MALSVHIKKTLGNFSLDVAFDVGDEWMGMLGASGCGKSMTLKCIAGIETPDQGMIRHNDRILFDSAKGINLPPQKRHVGYLFQSYALFPHMTVSQNILSGIAKKVADKQASVREMVSAFYLEGLEHKRPGQLSGGQQQRVALARLFASRPDMVLLDEPFSALDSHLKWKMEQELMQSMEKFQGTVLMVSHNRDEVYRMCSKVSVLSGGRIDVSGNIHDVFHDPGTVSAAMLTGCKNICRAEKIDDFSVKALDWGVTLKTDRMVPQDIRYIGIRAHYLQIDKESMQHENTVRCELVKEIDGPFSTILIVMNPDSHQGDDAKIRCEMEKPHWQNTKGSLLYISFPKEHILLLR